MSSQRRILSLWLPCLATDRLRHRLPGLAPDRPFAAVAAVRGRLVLAACDRAAGAAGLFPGQALADARALVPDLAIADADPAADAAALERLCDWTQRYTPWTAVDTTDPQPRGDPQGRGDGGLWLDVTGCTHLFGPGGAGERGLLRDLTGRLARAGLEVRAAIADTPGAAWAVARYGPGQAPCTIVPPGRQREALDPLPTAALRLPPDLLAALRRVGLRRIGELAVRLTRGGRAELMARYGALPVLRLDRALGHAEEPISPRRPVPPHTARLAFPEPLSTPDDLHLATRRLLEALCAGLEAAGQGARRLVLACWRVDAGCEAPPQTVEIGTARPARDPAHLYRLFAQKLERLEPGPGFEVMALSAPAADPFQPDQAGLVPGGPEDGVPVAELVDRLGVRLGLGRIRVPVPRASWWPERAVDLAPAADPPPRTPRPAASASVSRPAAPRPAPCRPAAPWPIDRPRPVRLLPRPEPVQVMAPVPDDPPLMFRWRGAVHRVRWAEGPERIAPEWWLTPGDDPGEPRDYYRVEDTDGRRFWLYRLGLDRPQQPAAWFLHGTLG